MLGIQTWGAQFIKYLPDYINDYYSPKSLLKNLSLKKRAWTGDRVLKKMIYQQNTGVGYTESGGNLPQSGTPRYTEVQYGRRYLVASARVGDDAIATSKGDGAIIGATKDIIRSTFDTVGMLEDYLVPRDGSGVITTLGSVTNCIAGGFITVADGRMMVPDAHCEIRAGTAHGGFAVGDLITSFAVRSKQTAMVASEARIFPTTAVPNVGQIQTDYITWGQGSTSSYGRAITGFSRLIDDSLVGTFQGVTLANFPQFTSVVLSNGGAQQNLTFSLLRRMLATLAQRSAVGQVSNMLVWTSAWDNLNFEEAGQGELRVSPTDRIGGRVVQKFQSVFGEFSVMTHAFAPYGEMTFLDRSTVELFTQQEMDWRPASDAGGIFSRSNDNLSYVASMLGIYDLGIHERSKCGKITNLNVTPLISY
jgi:hypothetical protein